MVYGLSESPAGLVYAEQPFSWPLRGFILLLGLGMFVIPVPYVLHASWRAPNLMTLLAVACIVLPSLLGGFFLWVGVAGALRVEVDRASRRLRCSTRGPLGTRHWQIGFDRIERIEVVRREASDDPAFYLLVLHAAGHRPLQLGVYDTREDAEAWRQRLLAATSA